MALQSAGTRSGGGIRDSRLGGLARVARGGVSGRGRGRPGEKRRQPALRWFLVSCGLAAAAVLAWRVIASGGGRPASEEVGCSSMEQLGYHVHVHLAIFVDARAVAVPANIRIRRECIAWLHTHETDGIVHVEAPQAHAYSLGAFYGFGINHSTRTICWTGWPMSSTRSWLTSVANHTMARPKRSGWIPMRTSWSSTASLSFAQPRTRSGRDFERAVSHSLMSSCLSSATCALIVLAARSGAVTPRELSASVGISERYAYKILKNLGEQGYISKCPHHRHRYRLHLGRSLGHPVFPSITLGDLIRAVRPSLTELSSDGGPTADCHKRADNSRSGLR